MELISFYRLYYILITQLSIQLSSEVQAPETGLKLLYNEEWTTDAEEVLIQKLQDVFSIVRNQSKSIRINLEIDVTNPSEAVFLIKKKLNQTDKAGIRQHKLSFREIEILGLIMFGYTNQEIADKLFISYETVRSHRKNILTKTGAHNTATLIKYYHHTFFEK